MSDHRRRVTAELAVLDACVLFPAALHDTLLRTAEARLYRPRWSDAILDEVRRNLVESRRISEGQAARLIDVMRGAFPNAMVANYEHLIPFMTNHPKDRHVLAAAVVSEAPVIVTSNLHDFSAAALQARGVQAQSPDEFLTALFRQDPAKVAEIFRQQVADLRRPPTTLAQALSGFARHAPGFAALLQDAFADAEHGPP